MKFKMNLYVDVKAVIFIVSVMYFHTSSCYPVNNRQDIILKTTTPKRYNDNFKFKIEKGTVPPTNQTYHLSNYLYKNQNPGTALQNFNEENEKYKSLHKVKSITLGEKTMMPQEDDDDDDGGEYEGFDDKGTGNCNKESGKKVECKESVPMMIIRKMDMVAMAIPVRDKDKSQRQRDKEWSEWSACSRTCGDGTQTRSRLQPSSLERERQTRVCHVADCGEIW